MWRRGRPAYSQARPLAFIHVPKCAGSGLRASLTQAIAPARPAIALDACLHGGFSAWNTLAAAERAEVYLPGDDWRRDADLILGHIAVSTAHLLWPEAQTIMLLREPITRLLSHYLYWRSVPDHEIARWRGWGACVALARVPLDDFLHDPRVACQTDNVATRMLLWPHASLPPDGFIAERHDHRLRIAARRALAGIDYVDVIDRPGFYPRLSAWLGRPLAPLQDNASAGWPPADLRAAMTPRITARLLWLTRLDRALWERLVGRDAEAIALSSRLTAMARYAAIEAAAP